MASTVQQVDGTKGYELPYELPYEIPYELRVLN